MHVTRSQPWDAVVGEAGPPAEMWREGTRMVVALRGEQDMSTATNVADALAGAGAVGQGDVVVDLSQVAFMDGAIVTVLLDGRTALRLQSRTLTLRAPSRSARRVLALCGLVSLLDPVSAVTAGEIGSCVTIRGPWSRPLRRGRRANAAVVS